MGRQLLYDCQGQQHICQLLKHGTQPSVTGELLHTLIELHNLELGVATPMLKADYKEYRVYFAEHGISGSDLAKLNFCRLYLQVCTISDIASGDGKHILPYILNCTKDPQQSTPYTWPHAE
jgi:hypothetical protein